jgi:hypothetical protein
VGDDGRVDVFVGACLEALDLTAAAALFGWGSEKYDFARKMMYMEDVCGGKGRG